MKIEKDKIKRDLFSFIKKYKKIIIIFVIVIVVIGLIFLGLNIFKKSQKEDLEARLTALGKDFYSEYYHKQIDDNYEEDERNDFLKKYETIGIKVNLDNLSRYPSSNYNVSEELKLFVNSNTDEECDREKTQVIIYPKSPYGKEDFELKIELYCGFEA